MAKRTHKHTYVFFIAFIWSWDALHIKKVDKLRQPVKAWLQSAQNRYILENQQETAWNMNAKNTDYDLIRCNIYRFQ